ncbi:MAG: glycine--tRNA ligase subunit beta [Anaerolineae bacterium]|nr:glycine--tRNA ligase subunit beta [Anaerolineae bacterium]
MELQEAIMRLQQYWAEQGCIIWQPYNVKVGAGTMNPGTFLRVLGPEPWRIAYVEPSVRPADGRYGENPNRWGQYYQLQVILKPDPGNPIELYLDSLRALGIDPSRHDVRFVEDNWQQPALGAWGLGWEVWLNGQEITQYTYFQQAGGVDLAPVSVEITYGLERIVMALQDVPVFQDIRWLDGVTYGDVLFRGEVEQCRYNFEVASIARLREMYDLYEAEARNALDSGLVLPGYDYVLLCSHVFNVLDARGAVGVTERASFFARMRDLAEVVAQTYLKQRAEMGYPLAARGFPGARLQPTQAAESGPAPTGPRTFLLEVGTEELPAGDLALAIEQVHSMLPKALDDARLAHGDVQVLGTPRRLVVIVTDVAPVQPDRERVVKGPPARVAYDERGKPTKAALGFARSNEVPVEALQVRCFEGRDYVVAVHMEHGLPATEVLGPLVAQLLGQLRFPLVMRWNGSGVTFSRPIRWMVAMLGEAVVPCVFAGVASGRVSRGIRPAGSPELTVASAEAYADLMREQGIMLDPEERRAAILEQGRRLAAEIGGQMAEDGELLAEVANMVEWPTTVRGSFAEEYLHLPEPVLISVMREHQRYFPIVDGGHLLPAFLAVANGVGLDLAAVRHGNEDVLRARYADAAYFYRSDRSQPLAEFVPPLATLTFQTDLGSMLDKTHRLERLVPVLGRQVGLNAEEMVAVQRAAFLCKADLATKMVVEHTSLQGIMGGHYARHSGELEPVARAIEEHYLPRGLGDRLPGTRAGTVLALADRFDSLVGLFAVGLAPTGSSDPYGLRRAALGIVQIVVGSEVPLSLRAAIDAAASVQPVMVTQEVRAEVLAFVQQRLRGYMLDQGLRYDVVEAVLAEQGDEPLKAMGSARALQEAVGEADWNRILVAYARAVRITRDLEVEYELQPRRFTEPATRGLYEAYTRAQEAVSARPEVPTLVAALRELVAPITRFFDEVLVMAEDPEVRANRLALLQRISALPKGIADLSRLEGF